MIIHSRQDNEGSVQQEGSTAGVGVRSKRLWSRPTYGKLPRDSYLGGGRGDLETSLVCKLK